MLTMTSLAAQNQFGALIDASQRQPVTVTRRGRPVAVVLSYEDYIQREKTIPYEVAQLISQNFPLQGQAAVTEIQNYFATASNKAAADGLTEADVLRMLNEE
jgi:prevent-host-death family protein